jgi:hypothetical protein
MTRFSWSAMAAFAAAFGLSASAMAQQQPLVAKARASEPARPGDTLDGSRIVNVPATGISFQSATAGSSPRTVSSKLGDIVSIADFAGCDATGAGDSTSCIQAALNSGALGVFVPQGTWKFSTLTLPKIAGFNFYGMGPSSVLLQTGAGIRFAPQATDVFNSQTSIHDLGFDGSAGTGNTIDTSFVQTLDLVNLYFKTVPTGYSSLFIAGNPRDGTYTHDIRAQNIRVYNVGRNVGKAGIELGPTAADSSIDRFIMDGTFTTQYAFLADRGAQSTVLLNSHPYNVSMNVVKLTENNNDFAFVGNVLDNSLGDIVSMTRANRTRFTDVWIEAINNGRNGVNLVGSFYTIFRNITFTLVNGRSTAASAIAESGGSSGNKLSGGNVSGSFANLFDLSGAGSYAVGIPGWNDYGQIYTLGGVAQTPQPQGSSTYLGANGSNANLVNTGWMVPLAGHVYSATIFTDATPARGQTFTFHLQKNGSTIGSATIGNGGFSATITLAAPVTVSEGDQISIHSVFSATSGPATPRYAVRLGG